MVPGLRGTRFRLACSPAETALSKTTGSTSQPDPPLPHTLFSTLIIPLMANFRLSKYIPYATGHFLRIVGGPGTSRRLLRVMDSMFRFPLVDVLTVITRAEN